MIQLYAFGTTEMIQEQVALVPESTAAFEAATSEHRNRDRLTTLPHEILLEIYRLLLTFADKSHFSLTSKYLHQIFDKPLYESVGKSLGWLPMFLAARQGNIATLNKCKKLGAPAHIFWDSEDDFKARASPEIQHGISPLDEAIMNLQVRAVEWFLAQGTSPNRQKGVCSPLDLRAQLTHQGPGCNYNKEQICSPLIRAFWMLRKNTIASLPATQRRTHRNQYSAFAMQKLRRRAEKARRIVDLLRGAGADLSQSEADYFAGVTCWLNPNTGTGPSQAPWVRLFDPNSITLSDWLGIGQILGFSR